ncbi:hypothetical protein D3C80_1862030 [compost metagenome]
MPCGINAIYRVTRTIHISVQPTFPEWAKIIWAVEPLERGIIQTIPITERIAAGCQVQRLAVECQEGIRFATGGAVAIRAVGIRLQRGMP